MTALAHRAAEAVGWDGSEHERGEEPGGAAGWGGSSRGQRPAALGAGQARGKTRKLRHKILWSSISTKCPESWGPPVRPAHQRGNTEAPLLLFLGRNSEQTRQTP